MRIEYLKEAIDFHGPLFTAFPFFPFFLFSLTDSTSFKPLIFDTIPLDPDPCLAAYFLWKLLNIKG